MSILFPICFLFGAVLGHRFKVLVLVPATALVVTTAIGIPHAGTSWQLIEKIVVSTIILQFGYFAGIGIRYLTAAAYSRRVSANSVPQSKLPGKAIIAEQKLS